MKSKNKKYIQNKGFRKFIPDIIFAYSCLRGQ